MVYCLTELKHICISGSQTYSLWSLNCICIVSWKVSLLCLLPTDNFKDPILQHQSKLSSWYFHWSVKDLVSSMLVWIMGGQAPWIQFGKLLHTGRLWLNSYQNPRNIVSAKIWQCMALMALQNTKKSIRYWKRPKKAEKVILKAGESKNGKIMIFFAFCDNLITKIKGIQYFDVSR